MQEHAQTLRLHVYIKPRHEQTSMCQHGNINMIVEIRRVPTTTRQEPRRFLTPKKEEQEAWRRDGTTAGAGTSIALVLCVLPLRVNMLSLRQWARRPRPSCHAQRRRSRHRPPPVVILDIRIAAVVLGLLLVVVLLAWARGHRAQQQRRLDAGVLLLLVGQL